ncbi:MAG: glycosyl transferase family 2 [Treponema sp. CETP13]|nr:MAG: glycosyl transferase family 2 [Treponema sp. CETP13]
MNFFNIKVSIIVPIFNVSKYLDECIKSIIKQTHENLEIILVNDGSTDNSGEIADYYASKDKRIRVIHQRNAGVSTARNNGINLATGEYVCFCDGDDFLMNDYISYLLNLAIQTNSEIALTTEMFTTFSSKQIKKDKISIYSGEEATVQILCYNIPIGVYCKIFKRKFLGENIRFLPNLFIGEGFNFNTTAFQLATKVGVGRRCIYYYRRDNENSATTKFSCKKWENGLMAINVIKENFIINSNKINRAWNFANWRTFSDVYDLMIMAEAEKKYSDMYKKCIKVIKAKGFYSLIVPVTIKQKIRAIIMSLYPRLIPILMIKRKNKYLKQN